MVMLMVEFCKERVIVVVFVYVDVEDVYEEISSGDIGLDFLVLNGYMDDFESVIGVFIGCYEDVRSFFDFGNGVMDMNKSYDIMFMRNDFEFCGSDE